PARLREVRESGEGHRVEGRLDLRALERLGREQLLHLEAAPADPLLVRVLHEGFERLAIRLDAVGPEILPGDLAPAARMVGHPRHGNGGSADLRGALERSI